MLILELAGMFLKESIESACIVLKNNINIRARAIKHLQMEHQIELETQGYLKDMIESLSVIEWHLR